MDKVMYDWRKKHPKCKWCKYFKYHNIDTFGFLEIASYKECILKDKMLKTDVRAKFCTCYEVKEK